MILLEKLDSVFNIVKNLLELISGVFDNWYYFGRIGVYSFKSEQENTLISRCGTVPTILIYTMELCREYSVANRDAVGDRQKFLKSLFERRYFIL